MRIKDVCERTGLTDRAIRLYMESGLVVPKQDYNYMGRRSISFSEEDVRILEAVATLRRAEFSIADIVRMQEDPACLPDVVACHRNKLAEEIEARQGILSTLEQYDAKQQGDYHALAEMIRRSASRNSVPKEDSGMNLQDIKRIIRKRIPALVALVLLTLALFSIGSMVIRTAFADTIISSGGGYALNYHWSASAWGEHIVILLSVGALLLALIPLVVYLAGGKRYWLAISVAFGLLATVLLLAMPKADANRIHLFEFVTYRKLFLNSIFYNVNHNTFVIKAFKFVPILAAMVLSVVQFFTDKPLNRE